MKKIVGALSVVLLTVMLAACGNKITTEDLKAHNWVTKSAEGDPDMIINFTDHVVDFKVDTSSMKSTASNEWESMGEELGKSIVENMSYKYEYTLEKNKLTWIDSEDKDNNAVYNVEKDGDNLVLNPVKDENSKDREKLVLKPYTKNKKSSAAKAATTSSSSKKKEPADLTKVVDQFKSDGLEVNNPRKMTKDDYGMAPLKAINGMIFGIAPGSDGEYQNARIFSFETLDDLNDTKDYYDDLGRQSSVTFSYTAADEDKLLLMQFNGDLPKETVDKYVDNADLTLTPVSFDTESSTSSQEEDTINSTSQAAADAAEQQSVQDAQRAADEQAKQQQAAQQQAEAEAQATTTQQQQEQQAQQDAANAQYGVAQEGEGPRQIAGRYGMSVDEFLEMNGMDQDNFYFNPGQEVRVK